MRLLINEDIPKASIVTLQNTGYNIRQAKGLKDKELLEIAISQKRIIVTFDGGIGDNILNGNFSFPSGIIKLSISNFNEINFSLNINDKQKQVGNTKNMLFSVDTIIAYVSKYITLKEGDLIFTGTPEGVGPTAIGDHFEGSIEGNKLLDFYIK